MPWAIQGAFEWEIFPQLCEATLLRDGIGNTTIWADLLRLPRLSLLVTKTHPLCHGTPPGWPTKPALMIALLVSTTWAVRDPMPLVCWLAKGQPDLSRAAGR